MRLTPLPTPLFGGCIQQWFSTRFIFLSNVQQMKLLSYLGLGLLFLACASSPKLTQRISDKYLIRIQAKIIDHGYFKFLKLKDSVPVKEITFIYSIDKKRNEFSVNLLEIKKVSPQYNIKYYESSEEWNNKERNSYREKYYKVIDENFLNISNEDKFKLLDSIAMNEK